MKTCKLRIFPLLAALCLLVGALAGCGQAAGAADQQILGTWKAERYIVAGKTMTLDDLKKAGMSDSTLDMAESISLEFKENGKLKANAGTISEEDTWKREDNKIVIGSGSNRMEATLEGGEMSVSIVGITFVLTKQA